MIDKKINAVLITNEGKVVGIINHQDLLKVLSDSLYPVKDKVIESEPLRAACLAVYVHGTIADRWIADGNDHLSLMASDLLSELPTVLHAVRSKVKSTF